MPAPTPVVRALVRRLLAEAQRLYLRSEAGTATLPPGCRRGICASRHIYAAIGPDVARAGHDSVTRRARTGAAGKAAWLVLAVGCTGASLFMPRSAMIYARPLSETAFLVEAAARGCAAAAGWGEGCAGALVGIFAELEQGRRSGRGLEQRSA